MNDYLSPELKSILKKKNLSSEQITELACKYARTKDKVKKELYKDLIFENMAKMVYKISTMSCRGNAYNQENFNDFFQYGMIGLMEALIRFKPSKKLKFSTYAFYWIKHYMVICNQENRPMKTPRDIYIRQGKYNEIVNDAKNSGSSINQVLKRKNITQTKFKKLQAETSITDRSYVRLNSKPSNMNGSEINRKIDEAISLQNESPDALDKLEKNEVHQNIKSILSEMPESERVVIEKIFYEDMSKKDLSDLLKIPVRKIINIEKRAIKKLKAKFAKRTRRQ